MKSFTWMVVLALAVGSVAPSYAGLSDRPELSQHRQAAQALEAQYWTKGVGYGVAVTLGCSLIFGGAMTIASMAVGQGDMAFFPFTVTLLLASLVAKDIRDGIIAYLDRKEGGSVSKWKRMTIYQTLLREARIVLGQEQATCENCDAISQQALNQGHQLHFTNWFKFLGDQGLDSEAWAKTLLDWDQNFQEQRSIPGNPLHEFLIEFFAARGLINQKNLNKITRLTGSPSGQ